MRRIVIAFATLALAAIALLGPGRSLLPGAPGPVGSAATQPDAPAATHTEHVAAGTAVVPAIAPAAGGARVDVTTRGATKAEQGYVLEAKVVSPEGNPVNDAVVRFYELVDFFGPREELIGSARTDGQGTAAMTYLPASIGQREIVVRFAGQGSLVPSFGTATFDASVGAPAYRADQPALLNFTRLVPYAAGAIVLAVWALIAFALLGTARGIAVSAAQTPAKEDTA